MRNRVCNPGSARKEDEKGVTTPHFSTENNSSVSSKHARYGDASQLKPWQWKPGQSGNPGGRPKVDVASEIARALFEQDGQAIFEAFRKILRKGSPYAFQVLSDRAYGKLKETHAIEHNPYTDVSDEDLEKRIHELEAKLGVPESHSYFASKTSHEPIVLPPADDETKPN